MESVFEGMPSYKKRFYAIAGVSLAPGIVSAIGLTYIGIPERFQVTVRRWLPEDVRAFLLGLLTLDQWFLCVLVISVVCLIWAGTGSHFTNLLYKNKCKEFYDSYCSIRQESESKSINCYRLFSNWLYSYSNHLGLTVNERVSLYKLDMNLFSCIGRYSENEAFNSKPARFYPRDQGVICRAWEVGSVEVANFPDPEEDEQAWIDHNVENYNFTYDELANIRMKSLAFFAIRLRDFRNSTIAVIVFESVKRDGLPFGKIRRLLNDQEKTNLSALIECLSEHIPTLESALEEGF